MRTVEVKEVPPSFAHPVHAGLASCGLQPLRKRTSSSSTSAALCSAGTQLDHKPPHLEVRERACPVKHGRMQASHFCSSQCSFREYLFVPFAISYAAICNFLCSNRERPCSNRERPCSNREHISSSVMKSRATWVFIYPTWNATTTTSKSGRNSRVHTVPRGRNPRGHGKKVSPETLLVGALVDVRRPKEARSGGHASQSRKVARKSRKVARRSHEGRARSREVAGCPSIPLGPFLSGLCDLGKKKVRADPRSKGQYTRA